MITTFAQQLAEAIQQRGWSQKEAARKLGVSQANISRWLSGGNEPTLSKAMKIAEGFGVGVEELAYAPSKKRAASRRVQESPSIYHAGGGTGEASMKELRERYRRAEKKEREIMQMALVVLFPETWESVIRWLGAD